MEMHCIARGFAEVRLAGEHGQRDCTVLHRLARPGALESIVDGAVHGTVEGIAMASAGGAGDVRISGTRAIE